MALIVASRGPIHRQRVLRGGAFNNNRRNVRAAYRNDNEPDNRNDNNGFRVVLCTFFRRQHCAAGT